ncbi:Aldehyde dehydrogenase 3 member B1 [Entomophthora muscae]|nr:Aldehyde dehydrogenase 3 member B1 [Entomophthora muscae]
MAQRDSYTRVVSKEHTARIAKLLPDQDSPSTYGTIVYGGDYNIEDRYFQPTIVTGLDPHKAPLMQTEIFGPIMPIIEMDSIDEAIAYIKSKDKPLSMYVFSEDSDFINKLNTGISSGSICINDVIMSYLVRSLPFGGVGASGINGYHGKHSIELFSHKKALYRANFSKMLDPIVAVRYPPIQEEKLVSLCFSNVHYPLEPSPNMITSFINTVCASFKTIGTFTRVVCGF